MRSKKAVGISMNAIVMAALALIVLIVIIVVFSGKIGDSNKASKDIVEPYQGENCEIPGTVRVCKSNCGGVNYGQLDCESGQTCCAG